MGAWLAIVVFGVALLTTFVLGDEARFFIRATGLGFLGTGFLSIFLMPVYGFLVIVGSRCLAELFRSVAAIANNTRRSVCWGVGGVLTYRYMILLITLYT